MHASDEVRCPLTGRAIDTRIAGPGQPPPLPSAPPPASSEPESERRDLIGRVLEDKYRPTAVLGEGGMGTVYEAEHLLIGRRVALKVLHPAHAQRRDAVWRFRHEARVAGSIGHPNICEIYDVGELDDGSPYLVMERLHGETLADRIERETELPFLDVIDVTLQVLSALVSAHEKGVIHRDIKPENIFLSERPGFAPTAKLLDFGISKAVADEDLHLTRTGMVMGTPYYMAPEQARGEVIDARIDLYGVGAVFYESLTGQRPFTAPNYTALLRLILFEEPRPLRSLRPSLPEPFELVSRRALAKDRDLRFQTAQEFMAALASLRAEVVAYRPSSNDLDRLVQPFRPSDRPPAPPPPSVRPSPRAQTPAPETPSPRPPPRSAPPFFSNEPTRHGLGPLPPARPSSPPAPQPAAPQPAAPQPAIHQPAIHQPAIHQPATLHPAAPQPTAPKITLPASLTPPPGPKPGVENDATVASAPLKIDEAEAIVRNAAARARATRPSQNPGPVPGAGLPPPFPPPSPAAAPARNSNPPGPLLRPSSLPRPTGSSTAPPPPPYRPKNPSFPPLPSPPATPGRSRSELPRPPETSSAPPHAPPAGTALPPGAYRGPLPPPPAPRRPAANAPATPNAPAGPSAPAGPNAPAGAAGQGGTAPPPDKLAPQPGRAPRVYDEDDENQPTRLYRPNQGDTPQPPRQKPPKKDP